MKLITSITLGTLVAIFFGCAGAPATEAWETGDGGAGGSCVAVGVTCGSWSDCCSLACSGVCMAPNGTSPSGDACVPAGESCASSGECCNGSCASGTCAAPSCAADGKTCTSNGEC
ncbi:MAG TPA: hypothetical protein VHS09_17140, partial [Polyangiaceae bacterium]|nr:hypothetical protein [Polyangiaceae bacterium]